MMSEKLILAVFTMGVFNVLAVYFCKRPVSIKVKREQKSKLNQLNNNQWGYDDE